MLFLRLHISHKYLPVPLLIVIMGCNHLHAFPALLVKRTMFFSLGIIVIPSLVCSSYHRERNIENSLGGTRAVCTSDFDRWTMPLPQPLPKGANTSPAISSRKLLENTFSVQSNEFCTCTCTCNLENICARPTYQPTSMPTTRQTAPPLGGPLDTSFQPTSSPTAQPTSLPSTHLTMCPTMEVTPMPTCPPTAPPLGGPLDTSFQPTSSPTTQPITTRMPTCPACILDNSGGSPMKVFTSNPTIANPFSIGVVAPEISGLQ